MLANWIDKHWLRIVQPIGYRAPEVILDAPWSTPIDIWSFGCIVISFYYFADIDIRDVRWKIFVPSIGTILLDFRGRSSRADDGTCASNRIAIDSSSAEQKCREILQ
jgi:serine/threonine protein kinase